MLEADYVIVGAGSAGCVLANRLTADGVTRVLLLEAGPTDWNPLIHIPVGYATTLKDPRINWLYETEADPGSGGRVHVWPRGKVLGGSSSINGLLYVRGQMADYDNWAQLGATGWGSADVLPYFRKAEANERLRDELHGTDGPLNVSDASTRHPVSDAVVNAGVEAGLPFNDDVNGEMQDGISYFQLTVKNGRRWSAARAYLKPAMSRANLKVETEAQAMAVSFEGARATGVTYRQDGRTVHARARREVILSGGAVNSPQLLELSGIGDPQVLAAAGIPVRHALPGVGANLQDHYVVSIQYRLKAGTVSVNELSRGWRLLAEALRYAVTRTGLLTLSAAHVQAYWRSRPGLQGPDVQYHILPATVDVPKFIEKQIWELERAPGLTIAPCQLRPESRGTIHVTSPDPFARPAIRPNYLSDPIDQATIVAGLRFGDLIARQKALAPWIDHRLEPVPGALDQPMPDDALLAHARERGSTIYHPVGTCRMGQAGDPGAVVDPEGRVHGIGGLRVIDASIMPRLTSGNTNAPTIMIAEKLADAVLADQKAESAA